MNTNNMLWHQAINCCSSIVTRPTAFSKRRLHTCGYLLTLHFFKAYKCRASLQSVRNSSKDVQHVAIVGSGPAGFYTAQHLIKELTSIKVDMYEKLPVPFGLVRFGVAPDHPEVKNCINQFSSTGLQDQFSFYGNVNVGKDVTVDDLMKAYHVVVFSYGAESDQLLKIPGENLTNCISARRFVGWYNGLPQDSQLNVDLSVDTAVILGHGNVALDVARILLTPTHLLKNTDITSHSYKKLSESNVKRVYIVGRRGPLQVSFTIKELREMTKLPSIRTRINRSDFTGVEAGIKDLERPRRRLTELMLKNASDIQSDSDSEKAWWELLFCKTPVGIEGKDRVTGVKLAHNTLQYNSDGSCEAVPTSSDHTVIPCGLVIRSIGYKSICVDPCIPFDTHRSHINNNGGRIDEKPGLYCSGWCGHPPSGVILTTMSGAFQVARTIIGDIRRGSNTNPHLQPSTLGSPYILGLLKHKCHPVISWEDWQRIDVAERRRGDAIGKVREKITDIDEMLGLALSRSTWW